MKIEITEIYIFILKDSFPYRFNKYISNFKYHNLLSTFIESILFYIVNHLKY